MKPHIIKLDLVIPVYNEEENLTLIYKRVRNVFKDLREIRWRIIYINDGSKDSSLNLMLEQQKRDSRVEVIDLSRNFGHQAAIAAGLALSDADITIVMDADLQDPPELIPELISMWKEGNQIVRAERLSRKERGIRRIGFELFHRFFKWISDFPIPSHSGVFALLDRQAVKEINNLTEKNRFFPGLRSWIGFKQGVVYYDRKERAGGRPKQSLKRLVKYAFDAIFSFSYKPLRIMTIMGILISLMGFSLASIFIIKRLLGIETAQTGFTTLVTVILFLGGVQLIAIGLLGEYLIRVYDEVKKRPLYIIKRHYKKSNEIK